VRLRAPTQGACLKPPASWERPQLEAAAPAAIGFGVHQRGEGAPAHGGRQYSNLFETQSDYFLYDFLDLAHAQGQSKAAGRAFSREERAMAARYPRFARSVARASGRR
jgi:hypothetical protein